jgi:hypothetical protein
MNVGYEGMVATQDTLHFGGDIAHIGAGVTPEQAREIAQYSVGGVYDRKTSRMV